ncbi:MAG: hypothetical protein GY928_01670 [Colwellia sp.]|nr:hypothetical protein [Colwellia sp.]
MESNSKYLDMLNEVNLGDIYIQQLFDFYRQCYLQSEAMQLFVQTSNRIPDELRAHPLIGISNRTVGKKLLKARTLEGGAMRGKLQQLGLFLPTGGELMRGCIVFPTFNKKEQIISAIGFRYGKRLRLWQRPIIHWNKPETDSYIHQGMGIVKEVIYGKTNH